MTKTDGKDKSLVEVLREITNHLTKNKADKQMTKTLHGAMTELAKSEGLLSVTSMNQLVHNPKFSVDASHICNLFANVFPLLEAMNRGIRIRMSRHKTPLRYPGGKQKLTPFILEVMKENCLQGGESAPEPYCGGAGVAIELLLNNHVAQIHLNDSCLGVYAFWHSILRDTDAFCRRISAASLTIPEWRRQREILRRATEFDLLDVGFSMFYLNRCNRSGIISGGVIGGLEQAGKWKIDARFPHNELITRVEAIAAKAASISITNWDAERFIHDYLPLLPKRALVYCDPPYFGQG